MTRKNKKSNQESPEKKKRRYPKSRDAFKVSGNHSLTAYNVLNDNGDNSSLSNILGFINNEGYTPSYLSNDTGFVPDTKREINREFLLKREHENGDAETEQDEVQARKRRMRKRTARRRDVAVKNDRVHREEGVQKEYKAYTTANYIQNGVREIEHIVNTAEKREAEFSASPKTKDFELSASNDSDEYGLHENIHEKRREHKLNTEFEMKRSHGETDNPVRAEQNELSEQNPSRRKKHRRKSKSKADNNPTFASSDKETAYKAFNETNAYEESKNAEIPRSEPEMSKTIKSSVKDIEFGKHDSSDEEFNTHKDGADIEFGTEHGQGDIEFVVGGSDSDIELKATSRNVNHDINLRNAEFELKRSGAERDGESDKNFVQIGQNAKKKKRKYQTRKISDSTVEQEIREHFEVQQKDAAGARVFHWQNEEEVNVKADRNDIELGTHKKVEDELFTAEKRDKEFELKKNNHDFPYHSVRGNDELNFGKLRENAEKPLNKKEKSRFNKDRKIRRINSNDKFAGNAPENDNEISSLEKQVSEERHNKLNTEREKSLNGISKEKQTALRFEHEKNISEEGKRVASRKETEERIFETETRLQFETEKTVREAESSEERIGESISRTTEKKLRNLKFEAERLREKPKNKNQELIGEEDFYFQINDGRESLKKKQRLKFEGKEKKQKSETQYASDKHSYGRAYDAKNSSANGQQDGHEKSNRFRRTEEHADKEKKKYDKAREKYEKEIKKRRNSLKFDKDDIKARIKERTVLEATHAANNMVEQMNADDNVAVESANKMAEFSEHTAYKLYRWQKNKPKRLKMKAEYAEQKYEREKRRLNFEKNSQAHKDAENAVNYTVRKNAEKKRQETVQRKLQRSLYRKFFQRQYRKIYVSNLLKRAADKLKYWIVGLLTSKAKLIIAGIAAVIILIVLIFGIAALMLTSVVGGYIDENITTSEEVRDFATEWANMEEALGDDYFADLYPGWIIHYYNLSAIGVDIGQVTAYYNAINGKFTYEDSISTTYSMTLYEMFEYVYSWDIEEEVINEGTEYAEYHVYATLNVRNIDDLINALTEEQREIYEACLQIFYQDEEYKEIWNELVM